MKIDIYTGHIVCRKKDGKIHIVKDVTLLDIPIDYCIENIQSKIQKYWPNYKSQAKMVGPYIFVDKVIKERKVGETNYSLINYLIMNKIKDWEPIFNKILENSEVKKGVLEIARLRKQQARVVPGTGYTFRAFKAVAPQDVKLIILGQDPYPTKGDADGLCFSSNAKTTPASLRNIFKEILLNYKPNLKDAEVSKAITAYFPDNSLEKWANQGVLLMNTALTTMEGSVGAHIDQWRPFMTEVIAEISTIDRPIVWMLWGKNAQLMVPPIFRNSKHLFLESIHPSPMAQQGASSFFGNNHFIKCNNFLKEHNILPIKWTLN